MSTEEKNEVDSVNKIAAELEQHLDSLFEKRSSTRESALESLNKALAHYYSREFVEKNQSTLTEALTKSIRKGSDAEVSSALKLLALVGITLGSDAAPFEKEYSSFLDVLARDDTRTEVVRNAAITTLATLNFLASTEIAQTQKLLELFQSLARTNALSETALGAWGFLATTVSHSYLRDEAFHAIIEDLFEYLSHPNLEVRLQSGEIIVYLIEVIRDLSASSGEELNDPMDLDLQTLDTSNLTMDEVIEKLEQLASERNRHASKKDIHKQRSGFKDFVAFIESGEFSSESLSFNKVRVSFSSWEEMIRLEFLREVLGEGLQAHFFENEFVQELFDAKVAMSTPAALVSKRQQMSPNSYASKSRTRQLRQGRSARAAAIAGAYEFD